MIFALGYVMNFWFMKTANFVSVVLLLCQYIMHQKKLVIISIGLFQYPFRKVVIDLDRNAMESLFKFLPFLKDLWMMTEG